MGEETKGSEENWEPVPMEKIGSKEFYQGERIIEDIVLPGERKTIKVEKVKKEEIYKDKIKKQETFIASLGRKKTEEEKPANSQLEYVEGKTSLGKKIFFAVLSLIVLGALIGGGYLWRLKKPAANPAGEKENEVVIPVSLEPSVDQTMEEKSTDENQPVAEVAPAALGVKVLNAGAAAGSAGRIKTLLAGQGYVKTEAGNGQGENVIGATVYYKGEQFKKPAEALKEILAAGKIKAEVKEALTAEQQSADVVVILGK